MINKHPIKYKLGVDLGTSSIGLVAYEIDDNNTVKDIIHMDSYVFGEPIVPKDKVTKSSQRRSARMIRRQIERKANRTKKIIRLAQFIGVKKEDVESINSNDIHLLRNRAVSQKITLAELVKVILHLSKNRGYKGNLKKSKDVKKYIEETTLELKKYNCETLGQLYYKLKKEAADGKTYISKWKNISDTGTFILREIVEKEFDLIWDYQSKEYDILKSDYNIDNAERYFPDFKNKENISLKEAFKSAIFYQRPIKWDFDSIGQCSLEANEKRTATAQLAFQEYRILSKINNIRVLNKINKSERELSKDEKHIIINLLNTSFKNFNDFCELPFNYIYDAIKLNTSEEKFNIDRSIENTKKGIKGNKTKKIFYDINLLSDFDKLSDKEQEIVIELLSIVTDYEEIIDNVNQLLAEVSNKLINDCTQDNIKNSKEFMKKIIEHLETDESSQLSELESKRQAYSVKALVNINKRLSNEEQEEDIINSYKQIQDKQDGNKLLSFNTIKTGNLLIDRPLREFQRVLKYTIHKLGANPQSITVELARELKKSLSMRNFLEKNMDKTDKDNLKIIAELKDFNILPSSENILRYKLWEEQSKECPYCGQTINNTIYYNEVETQIDHIIPQSIGAPNKYSNFVLVHTKCNKDKNNRTPYLAKQDINFEAVKKLAENLFDKMKQEKNKNFTIIGNKRQYSQHYYDLKNKISNLLTEKSSQELQLGFSIRQLQDTAWISKIVLEWCKSICPNVSPTFGILTAYLRKLWGINTLLAKVRIKENLPLYNKDGKEIDKEIWEFFNVKQIKFEDISKYSKINALFDEYKKFDKTAITQKDNNVLFNNFIKKYRKQREFVFDKRCDNRHHIIDASIIGLVTNSIMQKANIYYSKYGTLTDIIDKQTGVVIAEFRPTPALSNKELQNKLQSYLKSYVVWNKPDRLPSKAICDQTAYGIKIIDGNNYLTQRYSLAHLLKSVKTKEELENRIDLIVVGDKIKEELKKQLNERISKDSSLSLEEALIGKNDKDGIFFNGNKIKKVKCIYKEKTLMKYKENIDVGVKNNNNKVYKVYKSGGYACMDFDKKSGRNIELITMQKYLLEYKNQEVPENIIRVFANDTVYDKKTKEFYIVKSFRERDGIEYVSNNPKIKCSTPKDFKNKILVKTRKDIADIKK